MSWLQRFFQLLYNLWRQQNQAVRFRLTFGPIGDSMETITAVQQVPATAAPVDAKGNPVTTTFPTPPSWLSSDTTVLTVTPSADGLSAVATAVGKIGSATITVSGTPSGETSPISGTAEVQVTAAQAASFALSFGTAVTQTPAPPPPPPPPAA